MHVRHSTREEVRELLSGATSLCCVFWGLHLYILSGCVTSESSTEPSGKPPPCVSRQSLTGTRACQLGHADWSVSPRESAYLLLPGT